MTALASSFDGFIIDLDGVVHLGWEPIPGAVEAVNELRRRNKGVVFLTNEPRFARHTIAGRLRSFGLDVTPEAVVTAGWAAALMVASAGGKTYVIGSPELRDEVERAGVTVVGPTDAGHAENVLVGGHDGFDYGELLAACRAGDNGARLYATGRDATFPMPGGTWPATGAILAAVETALGNRAHIAGKPEPEIFRVARDRLGIGRIAVVGDRLDSDIAGGHRAALPTIYVGDEPGPDGFPQPDHVVSSLATMVFDGAG